MQSTGSERRGLIVLLSIIAILIVIPLLSGYLRSCGSRATAPSDTSVVVISAQPKRPVDRPDTTVAQSKRSRISQKATREQNRRRYRQRDFYEETLDQ